MTDKQTPMPEGAVEESIQAALARCVERAPLPFAITRTANHTLVYANVAFWQLASTGSPGVLGRPINFPVGTNSALTEVMDRAFKAGANILDQRLEATGNGQGDWRCSVWPVLDKQLKTEALGIEFRPPPHSDPELSLQRQVAEQMLLGALRERGLAEDAELSRHRATFLAEASHMLALSVDQASTLVSLSKLALPAFNAWCIIDVLHEGGAIARLGIFHPDPEKQKLARKLEMTWRPEPDDTFGAPAVMRTRKTVSIVKDVEIALAATAHSPENLHILRQLGIGALLTVPLIARNRMLGAITFVSAERHTGFSPGDIQLAEDLASRGALALDNAQVYDIALMLQKTAESANRAKTAFLGAMSHELRTPLNAIGGYIDLLDMGLRGPVTGEQHADFARVRSNQRHLTVLITEILNFARMGTDRVAYLIADVNATEAIQRAVEMVEPLFAQRKLIFDGVSGDSALVARADPERVTQIIVNLLSNAIKYTEASGHISAACGLDREMVTITVCDTGIGIPAGKLDSIFEPFIQMKEGLANREGGVGLGLSISRDLARAMNGDLTVTSVEGKGSQFMLTLPKAG